MSRIKACASRCKISGPVVHVPPLLILQTMQAVNWRLTDIAEASHEDNARVASFSVIPLHSEECLSVAAVHVSPDLPPAHLPSYLVIFLTVLEPLFCFGVF